MSAITVLAQDLYPIGTEYSTPLAWPANLLNVTATVLMSAQDMADATKQLTLVIEVSFNGGLSFSEAVRSPWVGNTLDKNGVPTAPAASVGYTSGNTPSHARVRIELPQTMSVGATLLNS